MSRSYHSKQRWIRKLKNKLYKSYLHLSFDDIWHTKKKDRTKNRILRKRLKKEGEKDVEND